MQTYPEGTGYCCFSHSKCSWYLFAHPFVVRCTRPNKDAGGYKFPVIMDRTYLWPSSRYSKDPEGISGVVPSLVWASVRAS